MKSIKKLFAMGFAVMMALSIPFSVSAAELEDAPIDESRTGSLTIYKYDLTNAEKDGVWDSSYVSTGVFDQTGVNDVLGGSGAALGNGETGYGYAIRAWSSAIFRLRILSSSPSLKMTAATTAMWKCCTPSTRPRARTS